MKMKLISVLLSTMFVMLQCPIAGAQNPDVETRIQALENVFKTMEATHKDELAKLSTQVQQLQQENAQLRDSVKNGIAAGIPIEGAVIPGEIPSNVLEINMSATSVVQGPISGGNGQQGHKVNTSYTADLEISKNFDDYGSAYAWIEAGNGAGIDGDAINHFSLSNYDATDHSSHLDLCTLYYEHYLMDKRVTITGGKLDPTCYLDTNVIANDETTNFLSRAFRNNSTIEFPTSIYGYGLRTNIAPTEWISFDLGSVEGDSDWQESFDSLFNWGQATFTASINEKPGHYSIYGWQNTNNHTVLKDSGRLKSNNFGCGLSIDQKVCETVTLFGRYGWANPQVSRLESAWSTGFQVEGSLWKRENDLFGIAIGQNIPGDQYEKSGFTNHKEGQFEAYYNFYVNEHLQLSPILQLVWNPNGVAEEAVGGTDDNITTIAGLRSQLIF